MGPAAPAPAQWVLGRQGMPVSPGIQRVSAPAHPPLTASQRWFADQKFGMFVHWGLDSLVNAHPELGSRPWADPAWEAGALGAELEGLGREFDPRALVELAQQAGQRYLVFTTKHHLGFANFASRHSSYTTAAMGPRRDFLRLLADECHRRGMPLFAYLSLPDLHHPDFQPLDAAAWERYLPFLLGQLEELAASYHPLAGFWLDPGPWNGPAYHYPLARIAQLVHRRWPEMLVGGRDWDGGERDYNSRVFLSEAGLVLAYDLFPPGAGPQPRAWPFEVCDTLNDSWFHQESDRNYRDLPTLITRLVEVVGRGGNYLLNHGPLPSGAICAQDRDRLLGVGQWLRTHGEAIYGTRPLGIPVQPWGWPLAKGDTIYLHLLRWPGARLVLPCPGRVVSAHWLHGGPIPYQQARAGITLFLPARPPQVPDAVAVLHLAATRRSPRVHHDP